MCVDSFQFDRAEASSPVYWGVNMSTGCLILYSSIIPCGCAGFERAMVSRTRGLALISNQITFIPSNRCIHGYFKLQNLLNKCFVCCLAHFVFNYMFAVSRTHQTSHTMANSLKLFNSKFITNIRSRCTPAQLIKLIQNYWICKKGISAPAPQHYPRERNTEFDADLLG